MEESWLSAASITARRLSTKPATDTTKDSGGMRPRRKWKASPEARNIPRRARKLASAVRKAPSPLDDAPDEPAVHLHRGAGDVGGPRGGEEHHHRRELLRGADAAHRDVGGGQLHLLLQRDPAAGGPVGLVLAEAVGHDAPRQDQVDRDAVGGEVAGQRLEEPRDARADAVGEDEPIDRLLHRARLDREDAAPARLLHVREHFADAPNRRAADLLDATTSAVLPLMPRSIGASLSGGQELCL